MANLRFLLILLCGFILIPIKSNKVKVSFVDVGQGDGIYIGAGEDISVDFGSSSSKQIGKYTVEPFFKSNGITSIDKAFITHADSDHTNGISYIGRDSNITIKELFLPISAKGDPNYDDLLSLSSKITYLKSGDEVTLSKGSIKCLSPISKDISDSNDHSLVLYYKYKGFSVLLMGDASKSVESNIINSIAPSTILKVGHHGSNTSTSDELLENCNPKIAILSYGIGNKYGHPHTETTDLLNSKGISTLSTATCGEISLYTDGKNLDIIKFIKAKKE